MLTQRRHSASAFSLFRHKEEVRDAVPGVMNTDEKQQQRRRRPEMNNGRRRECAAHPLTYGNLLVGDESHNDELQPDRRAGRRPDNDVEIPHLVSAVISQTNLLFIRSLIWPGIVRR